MNKKSNSDCQFALLDGTCNALACFSSEPCSGRDEKGNPRYRENRAENEQAAPQPTTRLERLCLVGIRQLLMTWMNRIHQGVAVVLTRRPLNFTL